MGGISCAIIIEGNDVQGAASMLAQSTAASCQLVDYLQSDEDEHFDFADAQPIIDFHLRAKGVLTRLNNELDGINRALAAKYSRSVG